MDEKYLIDHWTKLRTQIIFSQVSPALVLIGIFVTASFGKFETASDATQYMTLAVAAVTGILAIINQYAAVREGEALLSDLAKIDKPSALGQKIALSRGSVSLTAIGIVNFGVAVFALTTWTVLGL
jgi:hypothetical protein